jgi:SPW repeat
MERKQRWQDWVMLVFGVWLFFSPFILQYSSHTGTAAWDAYVLGVGVAFFAIVSLAAPQLWEEWVNLILGIWMIISPFVLGFHAENAATWNSVVLGLLIGGDAIWAMQPHQPMRPASQ